MRQKFENIRVIIPHAAMSAGTMLSCAADNILMAKHSSLGPIDPQLIFRNQQHGVRAYSAQAILDQFEQAQKEIIDDPRNLSSWLSMLRDYGPALLTQCKNQIKFGTQLVKNWLENYMFKGEEDAQVKAATIAEYLSSHENFNTHGKHLNISTLKEKGLKIDSLENDQELQERVLSVYHAVTITLNANVAKIICNQIGNSFIKQFQPVSLGQIGQNR